LVAVTVAAAIAAPEGSETVPRIVPVATWALRIEIDGSVRARQNAKVGERYF